MDIREIDRHDEALTRRFWEIGKAADELGRPWSGYWSWPEARAAFTSDPVATTKVLLEVFVDPPRRRRGAGAALLEASMRIARARERDTVVVEVATPLEGDEPDGLRLTPGVSASP